MATDPMHSTAEFDRDINVDRVRRRWSVEELQVLAGWEARLVREGGGEGLVQRLVCCMRDRTVDSIKGVRKREDYRRMVCMLLSADAAEGRIGAERCNREVVGAGERQRRYWLYKRC